MARTTLTAIGRCVFVAFSLVSSLASAEPSSKPVGVVTVLEGKAYAAREGDSRPLPLDAQSPVFLHDVIETQPRSRLKILFHNESLVTAAENSRVVIQEFGGSNDSNDRLLLTLDRGMLRASVGTGPSSAVHIVTPGSQVRTEEGYFTVWVEEGVPSPGPVPPAVPSTPESP